MNNQVFLTDDYLKTEVINTGGGCYVRAVKLTDDKVAILSDEYIGIYKSIDDFLEYNEQIKGLKV